MARFIVFLAECRRCDQPHVSHWCLLFIRGFPCARHRAMCFENIASFNLRTRSAWEVLLPFLLGDEKPYTGQLRNTAEAVDCR